MTSSAAASVRAPELHGVHLLEKIFVDRHYDIEHWFHLRWRDIPAPFYTSVDIRNAGFKIAPVDTNLFPAGFNNLHADSVPLCLPAIESAVTRYCPRANQVLIIPENHTRNKGYLASLRHLYDLISQAGFRVKCGSLDERLKHPMVYDFDDDRSLVIHPIKRTDYLYVDGDFVPCAILLNNDLSSGSPKILENLSDQHVIPPLELGWHNRSKKKNFDVYSRLAKQFCDMLDIDQWLVTPWYAPELLPLDFDDPHSIEAVQDAISALLASITEKYAQYGVKERPFVMMKSASGTYGMGVVSIQDPKEIAQLNRKKRNRMRVGKGGVNTRHVVVQEGVPTCETAGDDQAVAEPVAYLIDHFVVGGFYRIHKNRGTSENLNAPGMHFRALPLADPMVCPRSSCDSTGIVNRFYACGVIARLATAAAAIEISLAS